MFIPACSNLINLYMHEKNFWTLGHFYALMCNLMNLHMFLHEHANLINLYRPLYEHVKTSWIYLDLCELYEFVHMFLLECAKPAYFFTHIYKLKYTYTIKRTDIFTVTSVHMGYPDMSIYLCVYVSTPSPFIHYHTHNTLSKLLVRWQRTFKLL